MRTRMQFSQFMTLVHGLPWCQIAFHFLLSRGPAPLSAAYPGWTGMRAPQGGLYALKTDYAFKSPGTL